MLCVCDVTTRTCRFHHEGTHSSFSYHEAAFRLLQHECTPDSNRSTPVVTTPTQARHCSDEEKTQHVDGNACRDSQCGACSLLVRKENYYGARELFGFKSGQLKLILQINTSTLAVRTFAQTVEEANARNLNNKAVLFNKVNRGIVIF